jgi:capsular polysaccharide export protein
MQPFEQITAQNRHFLFLQGPHGPFFDQLSDLLRKAGARTRRVGFNKGDEFFWSDKTTYHPFHQDHDTWQGWIKTLIADHAITDLVLYADTRPIHATAIKIARDKNLTIHVFEEGYLRPYWVTYERGGANGHSKLMHLSVAAMQAALNGRNTDLPDMPAKWGDLRQHIFYGMVYHYFVFIRNRAYKTFKPHRNVTVAKEFWLHLHRALSMPLIWLDRLQSSTRIHTSDFPYHLVLLQLEHDASFRHHGPFDTLADFIELVIKGFAAGAQPHHHLVFKAHPLEDGRTPLRQNIRRLAKAYGVWDRVHFVPGGKLARLLNDTKSVVTVNSTAAQQALWRGLPVKAFGQAVYRKPEFVSNQPLHEFFANPMPPQHEAYQNYRQYLLETSQLTGSFYSKRGRKQLLRRVIDPILAQKDPYDCLKPQAKPLKTNLNLVGQKQTGTKD